MKKIRNKCFETNSSSAHSVTVAETTDMYDTLLPDDNGKINIRGNGEFGWGYDTYNDPYTKAQYLLQYSQDDEVRQDEVKEVIREHTQAKSVNFENGGGYVDHNSIGETSIENIFLSKDSIKEFIFNKNSILIIDNDNH